jgi:hypothetical protein
MSRLDQDVPVQDSDETDPYNAPEFIRWSAALEAQADCQNGLGIMAGQAKLIDRGATADELRAYKMAYNAEVLRRIAKDCGFDMENPYTTEQEIV